MNRTWSRRPRDAGASAAEYAGLIVLAAVVIGALTYLLGGTTLTQPVRTALCQILHQQTCGRTAGPGANGNGPTGPTRRPLTKADYEQQLCRQLQLDCADWDTTRGVSCNDSRIQAGYGYYQRIYDRHPEVRWAGLAKLAGDTVYGGMQDIHVLRGMTKNERLRWLAKYGTHLPKWVIDQLANLSGEELDFYETKLAAMQKNILTDLGWQLAAYDKGGLPEMRRLAQAGQLDGKMLAAWADIASGDPKRIQRGNLRLTDREQRFVLQPYYDKMLRHPGGKAVTYLFSLTAGSPVPGAQPFGKYAAKYNLPGGIVIHDPLPIPNGNVANVNDRWDWLTKEILPKYNEDLKKDPQAIKNLIDAPLTGQARKFRILPNQYVPYNPKDGVC